MVADGAEERGAGLEHAPLVMWCDGGMVGKRNPSPEGVYWSVGWEDADGFRVERSQSAHYHTNNEAEWLALIEALRWASCLERPVEIRSDSQLVVNQFNGRWQSSTIPLTRLRHAARDEAPRRHPVTVVWVPRKEIVACLGH